MRCDQLENELACFIDGELASPERREVENHLGDCAACRGLVEEQQQVKRLLKQTLRTPQAEMAPVGLMQRVHASLDTADGRGGWRWRLETARPFVRTSLSIMVPVAAALALVVGYVQTVEPIINDSIVKHQRNLPLEVTGGPEAVRSWFDGKVPFAVSTPKLPSCSLRGGRLSHLGSREAALLQYDQNGHTVSVFVFDGQKMPSPLRLHAPDRRIIGNREVFIEGASGYHVAVFRNQGLGYAITTGNVAEAEFIQMVSAAVGQFSP